MYTKIKLSEMSMLLKEEKGWAMTVPTGEEAFFDFKKKGFTIRVYSSITKSGTCRAKGKDAIRVVILWERPSDKNYVGVRSFPRVTRQENWRKNLKSRVMGAFYEVDLIKKCPRCDSPLSKRRAKESKNEFWGCSNYPLCRYTKTI